jgi:glycosyltransferase involved in cell wall biosynthesis
MLSVVIITHNEERNIQDALESVTWADEIIVVDSFSTDGTAEICRQYTDKVFSVKWSGFAEQKNKGLSMAAHQWVFVLDADERITGELRKEILDVVQDKSSLDGYYIPRKNYFAGKWIKHGGWWPDYTLRLFRREKGLFGIREVHEAVTINGTTGYLKSPMEHYSYKNSADYLKRMKLYSFLAAKELFKEGRNANFCDIIIRPIATFFRMSLLQLGILDGTYGVKLAYLYSVYTYEKYSKLREMGRHPVKKGMSDHTD